MWEKILLIFLTIYWIQQVHTDVVEVNYRNVDQFGKFSSHVTVFEGDTVILPCQFSLLIFNQIGINSYWQVDSVKISNDDFVHDQENNGLIRGQGSYKIRLTHLRPEQSGRYGCQIRKINFGILHQEEWHLKIVRDPGIRFLRISSALIWAPPFSQVKINCTVGGMRPRLELGWQRRVAAGGWKQLHTVRYQLFLADTTQVVITLTFDLTDRDEELMCRTLNADGINDIARTAIVKVNPVPKTTTPPPSSSSSPSSKRKVAENEEIKKGFEVVNLSIIQYGPGHILLSWMIWYHEVTTETPNCTVTYRAAHEEMENDLVVEGPVTRVNVTELDSATIYVFFVTAYTSTFTSQPSEEVAGSTSFPLQTPVTETPQPPTTELPMVTNTMMPAGTKPMETKRRKRSETNSWDFGVLGFQTSAAAMVALLAILFVTRFVVREFCGMSGQKLIQLTSLPNPRRVLPIV